MLAAVPIEVEEAPELAGYGLVDCLAAFDPLRRARAAGYGGASEFIRIRRQGLPFSILWPSKKFWPPT